MQRITPRINIGSSLPPIAHRGIGEVSEAPGPGLVALHGPMVASTARPGTAATVSGVASRRSQANYPFPRSTTTTRRGLCEQPGMEQG